MISARRFLSCCLAVGFLSLAGVSAAAAEPKAQGYVDYSAYPVGTDVSFNTDQLKWLNQVFVLMGSTDFTFVYRLDARHWIGMHRERLAMILNIHDETARYDFRGLVDRSSGRITVIKGVSWKDQSKQASARTTAEQAVVYLRKVLTNQRIFGASATVTPAVTPAAPSAPKGTAEKPAKGKAAAESGSSAEASGDPLKRLMEGNARFVSGNLKHGNQTTDRRAEVAKGQKPFAVILTCSDSRLPPEILFDQGLGDLFVIRTAGEVVSDLEIGSIEYAAEHLCVAHLMVLGHERCGAVQATVDAVTGKGEKVSENIGRIAAQIQPAVEAARKEGGDLVDKAIRQNVLNIRKKIEESPVIEESLKGKHLTISPAYYDLDSGAVSLLEK